MDVDAFGKPLQRDDTINCLQAHDSSNEALMEVMARVARASQSVLRRQLERYFTGPLSELSKEMERKAASAPAHNIWAERTLGIVDAQARRAPNSSISFLDAKAKSKMNGSIDWLLRKDPKERESVVSFCVRRGGQKRLTLKERKVARERTILKRTEEKLQKRDMAACNKVSRELKRLGESGSMSLSNPWFDRMSQGQKDKFQNIICLMKEDPDSVGGIYFDHCWSDDGVDVVWHGKILKVCKGKGKRPSLRVAYWELTEQEDDAVDCQLPLEDLLADAIFGDLVLS